MARILGLLADRFVGAIAPKATAGACPCNDVYFSRCSNGKCKRCQINCDCTKTTCSACIYNC